MTFDIGHSWAAASLSDPYWVSGAFLWSMLIAHAILCAISARGVARVLCVAYAAFVILTAQFGTYVIANFFQMWFADMSLSYSGGPLWLAVPLSLALVAARVRWSRTDRWLVVARTMAVLLCLHTVWAVVAFPNEVQFEMSADRVDALRNTTRVAPVIALSAVFAIGLLDRFLGDRGSALGWRAWFSARLQVAVIYLGFLIETHVLMIATFPFLMDEAFPWLRFFVGLLMVLGVMAVWRVKTQRASPRPR